MEIQAKAKFIKISPRKIRLVVGLIRGLGVEEAAVQLKFSNKNAAIDVAKLLKSAISNAEENFGLRQDNLFVKEVRVDEGPTLKRWTPRAFGRATPIRKRSSHIIMTLGERIPTAITDKKKAEKKVEKNDIVKVEDFDELKALEKEEVKEEKVSTKKEKGPRGQTDKGFVNKIFNRKSGQK